MLAIKTENLSKLYHVQESGTGSVQTFNKWALRDLTININTGDCVAVIGGNGSGKSTLLKLLARIIHPTTGKMFINGSLTALLEVGIGFNYELSGRENVFLNGALLGIPYQTIKHKFDEIVNFAQVEEFIDTPVKYYSSGMSMRLGFAIMMQSMSDVVIIDESLAVGDLQFQQQCLKKLNELNRIQGKTVLLVSHDMDNIIALCNRALLLEDGNLAADGSVLEVASQYFERSTKLNSDNGESKVDRFGSGTAIVRTLQFTDLEGNVVDEIESGRPLKINFDIENLSEIAESKIVLACGFGLSFGNYLMIWISSESGVSPKNGQISLTIPSLGLRPGKYYFSYQLGIGDLERENIADAVENGWVLSVKNSNIERINLASSIGDGHFSS